MHTKPSNRSLYTDENRVSRLSEWTCIIAVFPAAGARVLLLKAIDSPATKEDDAQQFNFTPLLACPFEMPRCMRHLSRGFSLVVEIVYLRKCDYL